MHWVDLLTKAVLCTNKLIALTPPNLYTLIITIVVSKAMFEIGTIVRFKYTGAKAEILEDHMDGSFTVWLIEDEDESIAFEDDIIPDHAFKGVEQSEVQKQLAQKKPPKPPKPRMSTEELYFGKVGMDHAPTTPSESSDPPAFKATPIAEAPPSNKGCYLAFHPTAEAHYTIYLVNDTDTSFSFQFELRLGEQLEHGFNKMIPAFTYFAIGEFWQAQFNDRPLISFECPRFGFSKTIKLKYRKFVRTQAPVPLLGIETYQFQLFEQLNPYAKKSSLKEYTKEHQSTAPPQRSLYQKADLLDVASFGTELDLHAEKLVSDTSEYSSRELFELQLQVLEDYVNKAHELGLSEIFIIHGLGKGKLRQAVDHYLKHHGAIKTYNNDFHEKYGFGATKVVFK